MDQSLSWQPIYLAIEEAAKDNDRLFWIVVPFVKLDALKRLLRAVGNTPNLVVIVRWRLADLAAGVSDLEVFTYLRGMKIKLYANPSVHMKLYVFESNKAVISSGNLTLKGLGYADSSNIEVASYIQLQGRDWIKLHGIERSSHLITAEIYERYKKRLAEFPEPQPPAIENLVELFGPCKQFTIGSLPATDHPDLLIEAFFDLNQTPSCGQEFFRRVFHDLATFEIDDEIFSRDELIARLRSNFCNSPFVKAFLAHLRQKGAIHFGGVTSWIHSHCDDVPLPYRWELKEVTRCLYNWLEYFVDEVTWDRPHHSQVIRWKKHS